MRAAKIDVVSIMKSVQVGGQSLKEAEEAATGTRCQLGINGNSIITGL